LMRRKPGDQHDFGKRRWHFLKQPSAVRGQRGFTFQYSKSRLNIAKYILTMFTLYGSLLGDGSEEAAFY